MGRYLILVGGAITLFTTWELAILQEWPPDIAWPMLIAETAFLMKWAYIAGRNQQ